MQKYKRNINFKIDFYTILYIYEFHIYFKLKYMCGSYLSLLNNNNFDFQGVGEKGKRIEKRYNESIGW